MCTWLCDLSSNSSLEKHTWDVLSLKSLRGRLAQPTLCSGGETEVQRGAVGLSTRTGPDSKTPSKLEAEPSNGLEAAREETGFGKELSRSPAILGDP